MDNHIQETQLARLAAAGLCASHQMVHVAMVISPWRWWKSWIEHLRFKYTPRFAEWLVAQATKRARDRLAASDRKKILIDVTVFYHAVTHETAWISTGTSTWGNQPRETGYAARVAVHAADSKTREYENVCYLAGIAHLFRTGILEPFTSAELEDEKFRQPVGRFKGYGYFDYSLFSDLNAKSIDGHAWPTLGMSSLNLASSEQQQRDRLRNYLDDPLYAALVKCLGPGNTQDAWHIYTAEKHEMLCYLTMDFSIIKALEAQANNKAIKSLCTMVLTPKQFGERYGVGPVAPHCFSYNNASFFVRSDMAMPGNKRRPLNGYKKR